MSNNTTETYWSIDGVSLQTYAFNISTWGGDAQSVPNLRGDDLTIPYAAGDVWLDKVPDARTISFGMWVIGANEDGTLPVEGSSRELFEKNWRMLKKLMWTPNRQVNLTKRFRDWNTGEIVEATAKAQFAGGLQPTMNGTQRAQFTVQFKLADPFFYGEEKNIEISPYEAEFTNSVPAASPYNTLWGFNPVLQDVIGTPGGGPYSIEFSRQNAYRKNPSPIPEQINRTRPDDTFAKLVYKNAAAPSEGGISNGLTSLVPVTAGEVMKFSARVLLTNRSNSMRLVVQFQDASGNAVGSPVRGTPVTVPKAAGAPETVDIPASSWTKLTATGVTVPAGATRAVLSAVAAAGTGTAWREGRTNYAQNPSFEGSMPLNEVARNKVKNPVFENIPTTPATNIVYTNLALDPDFSKTSGEQILSTNWLSDPSFEVRFGSSWKFVSNSGSVTAQLRSGGAHSGTYYQSFSSTGTTAVGRISTETARVTPAGDITFSMYFKGTNANVVLVVDELESTTKPAISTITSSALTLSSASTWVRHSVTLTNQRSNTINRVTVIVTATGTAMNNIGMDSGQLESGNAPTTFFYYDSPSNVNDSTKYKRVPVSGSSSSTGSGALGEVSWTNNTVGESVKYVSLPRRAAAMSTGVRVAQALNGSGIQYATNTSLTMETLDPGEPAAQGASIYTTVAADVGKTLTVTGYVVVPAGYSAAQDYTSGTVPRGFFIKDNLAAGTAVAPTTAGTHLIRAFITPTAAGQVIRFGGGGAAGTVLRLARLTVVRQRYEGIPFSGDIPVNLDNGNLAYTWSGTFGDSISYVLGTIPVGVSKTPSRTYDIQYHRTLTGGWSLLGTWGLKVIRTGSAVDAAVGVSLGKFPAGRYYVQGYVRIPSTYNSTEDAPATTTEAPRAIGTFATALAPNSTYFQAPDTSGDHTVGGVINLTAADEIMVTGGGLQGQSIDWAAVAVIPISANVNKNIVGNPFSGNPGSAPNNPDISFRWTGTAHNSESVALVPTGLGDPGIALFDDPMPVYQSSTWWADGGASLHGTPRNSLANLNNMRLNPGWLPRAAGTYTLQVQINFPVPLSGQVTTDPRRFLLQAGGTVLTSPSVPNTTGPQTFKWTFTVPTDVTGWDYFMFQTGHADGDVFMDSLLITEGDYSGAYFDGSFGNYKWNGVANNSTSSAVPDVIYANKFSAVQNDCPYDFFTGYGLDTTVPTPPTQYYYAWQGATGASPSDMYAPVTTPYVFDVPGDYLTRKVRFEANAPLSSFTVKNTTDEGVIAMTYGFGTTAGIASIDVDNFVAFSGLQRTSAYVDNSGSYFWFPLKPGQNSILTSGIGTGNLNLYYRPAWL